MLKVTTRQMTKQNGSAFPFSDIQHMESGANTSDSIKKKGVTMFSLPDWNIEAITGYKPKTTFYMDFSIADKFGVDAIKDTYKRALKHWKDNVEYLTELVMVMSWKSFEHEKNPVLCELYSDLYYEADDYAMENLSGDDLEYYLDTTD